MSHMGLRVAAFFGLTFLSTAFMALPYLVQ
jgi:hypothetical protein